MVFDLLNCFRLTQFFDLLNCHNLVFKKQEKNVINLKYQSKKSSIAFEVGYGKIHGFWLDCEFAAGQRVVYLSKKRLNYNFPSSKLIIRCCIKQQKVNET